MDTKKRLQQPSNVDRKLAELTGCLDEFCGREFDLPQAVDAQKSEPDIQIQDDSLELRTLHLGYVEVDLSAGWAAQGVALDERVIEAAESAELVARYADRIGGAGHLWYRLARIHARPKDFKLALSLANVLRNSGIDIVGRVKHAMTRESLWLLWYHAHTKQTMECLEMDILHAVVALQRGEGWDFWRAIDYGALPEGIKHSRDQICQLMFNRAFPRQAEKQASSPSPRRCSSVCEPCRSRPCGWRPRNSAGKGIYPRSDRRSLG
ncbi:MAG TPA: hypothetical protein VIM56_07395 [Rhizomicrobium sp.]